MQTNFITKNKNVRIKSLTDNILSHHSMGAFFSGTDTSTLRAEGNDTNCFVSLIVDTKGTYQAAITRKVQEKKTIVTKNYSSTYEFFGEGEKMAKVLAGASENTEVEDAYIEYFMLDVEIEHVDNPLAYLDTRFDEIQEAKKKRATIINPPIVTTTKDNQNPWLSGNKPSSIGGFGSDFDEDYSFRDYLNDKEKVKEQTLFSEEEMDEMIDPSGWEPDPTIIHKLAYQMLTCSLMVTDNGNIEQWITRWMDKKYKEIFGPNCDESFQFQSWKEFIVEFMQNQYVMLDDNIPDALAEESDVIQSKVANAMCEELHQYNPDETNSYINDYIEVLTRYIYE